MELVVPLHVFATLSSCTPLQHLLLETGGLNGQAHALVSLPAIDFLLAGCEVKKVKKCSESDAFLAFYFS